MSGTKWAAAGNGLMGARDFMRVADLMLREGDWNGGRIFAASWIRRFTGSTAYQNLRSNRDCYWVAKYPADLYRTTGSGQNWLLVVPSLDLLLTYNGRTPASRKVEIDRESLEAALRLGHRSLRRVRWHRGERRRLNATPPRR